MDQQLSNLQKNPYSKHFIEITDSRPVDRERFTEHHDINDRFQTPLLKHLNVGVVNMGRPAPGVNNVVDGLLTFSENHNFMRLFGFKGGAEGLLSGDHFIITRDNFRRYKNQGGADFLGTS